MSSVVSLRVGGLVLTDDDFVDVGRYLFVPSSLVVHAMDVGVLVHVFLEYLDIFETEVEQPVTMCLHHVGAGQSQVVPNWLHCFVSA